MAKGIPNSNHVKKKKPTQVAQQELLVMNNWKVWMNSVFIISLNQVGHGHLASNNSLPLP